MIKKIITERELAAVVVLWLRQNGWKVYQEVPFYECCIDIIAERDSIIWAIECKMTWNQRLMRQIYLVQPFVDKASVAVPRPLRKVQRKFYKYEKGVGIIEIDRKTGKLDEKESAPIQQSKHWYFREMLSHMVEESVGLAGQPSKGRISAFSHTCDLLRDIVKKNPGITLREVIYESGIKHHYANNKSAYASLGKWISHKKIKGVYRKNGGLYLE